MPLIQKRDEVDKTLVSTKLTMSKRARATLTDYVAFIEEDEAYVLTQLIDVLAKDRDFIRWRAERETAAEAATVKHPAAAPRKVPADLRDGDADGLSARVRTAAAG